MKEIEILFEYKESRTNIKCPLSEVRDRIVLKLEVFGIKDPFSGGGYILQRFSKKWDAYVDVDENDSILDGDRLTVISSAVSPSSHGKECLRVISKLKTPTLAEAKVLSSYFPSTSGKQKSIRPFDPSAQSVVFSRQKKKKAAITRQRDSIITVILMDKYFPCIPRGKRRQKLASMGKFQTIQFNRLMSHREVKNKIVRAFEVDDFVVLDSDAAGHNLVKCENQDIDGEKVVKRKGCLYLCKEFDLVRWL